VAAPVRRVLVVAKTHLDVGFTATAAEVRRRYLEEFFPRAVATAAELRRRGAARLCWTTGSWILTEALRAEGPEGPVAAAVARGDLAWHAMPFTTHTELADPGLLRHGLSLSARLDERFGRRTRAAKLTDVPGHTRALVPVLAGAGVELLHVGVNPAWPMPEVPTCFRWEGRAPAGGPERGSPRVTPSVVVLYQPGGYGDVVELPGTDVAAAVVVTGDNEGPPTVEEVERTWSELADRYPGAEVVPATLDDVADALRPAAATLPVVTAEIGDPWLHGAASDPWKLAGIRALCRLRRRWSDDGRATPDDAAVAAASESLLLAVEHTWGLDQKEHWPETGHWSPAALARVRELDDTRRFEASWAEQRGYLVGVVDALAAGGRDDLAAEASAALAELVPPRRGELGGEVVDPAAPVRLGPATLRLGGDGSVVGLAWDGASAPVDDDHPLSLLRHRSWDAADVEEWFARACPAVAPEDRWWATWDNTKPGLRDSGARSTVWTPVVRSVVVDGGRRVVAHLAFPDDAVAWAGAPPAAALVHDVDPARPGELRSTLCWWDRPAARWPASTWWEWRPRPGATDADDWRMLKLGDRVDPDDVVVRGGVLHAVEEVGRPGLQLELVDAPLVQPLRAGEPDRIPVADRPTDGAVTGWRVWCADNRWGTNFPMWCPGDVALRAVLRWAV
jgi:hypothetical protein